MRAWVIRRWVLKARGERCSSVPLTASTGRPRRVALVLDHWLPLANPWVHRGLPGPSPLLVCPDHLQRGEGSAFIEPEVPPQVVSVLRFWHSAKRAGSIFEELIGLRSLRIPHPATDRLTGEIQHRMTDVQWKADDDQLRMAKGMIEPDRVCGMPRRFSRWLHMQRLKHGCDI